MSSYKVSSDWTDNADPHGRFTPYIVQTADLIDSRGNTWPEGAWRVIDGRTRKPAVRGKGGSVPFKGESAWMDAERLAYDLAIVDRRHVSFGTKWGAE